MVRPFERLILSFRTYTVNIFHLIVSIIVSDTCGPGSYLVNGSCELCPIGTYQPNEGGRNCHSCPVDTSTKYVGAKVLADCVGKIFADNCKICHLVS